jgi:PTH1 family peptidyl-tRNA hydrolase
MMWLINLFKKRSKFDKMKKFLIVGLGNVGDDYIGTRHNIGFEILDMLIEEHNKNFELSRYALKSTFKYKGKQFICIKPSTYMNLSGKAVKYWIQKEKINLENILIITDDLNLPFCQLRKSKGSSGGHNGLKSIEDLLNTPNYPRLRFGIGDKEKTSQTDFVLGKWKEKEKLLLNKKLIQSCKIILSFGTDGIQNTMNNFNNKT